MRLGATSVDADAWPRLLPASSRLPTPAPDPASPPQFRLSLEQDRLTLVALHDRDLGSLTIDFAAGAVGWRGQGRAQHERLVRATRAARSSDAAPRRIVDGTGGLGTDAWLLASAGAEVTVIEHHPVLGALLLDALRRMRPEAAAVADRISVRFGDTRSMAEELVRDVAADLLYLDPMYPPRRKQALGDRRLRLVGALLAADGLSGDDAEGLLAAGLAAGFPAVVLKCPRRVSVMGPRPPNHALSGRSTRFDVWLNPVATR